jgi:cell division septation protein DedD
MKAWLRFFQFFSGAFTPLFFLFYFFIDYSDESIAFGIVLLSIISTGVGFIGANSHSDEQSLAQKNKELQKENDQLSVLVQDGLARPNPIDDPEVQAEINRLKKIISDNKEAVIFAESSASNDEPKAVQSKINQLRDIINNQDAIIAGLKKKLTTYLAKPEPTTPKPRKKTTTQTTSKPAKKEKAKPFSVLFTYENAKGEITEREVSVYRHSRERFNGWCFHAGGHRSFLKSNIIGHAVNTETGEIMDW